MSTPALFDPPPMPAGAVRTALDAALAVARDGGADVPADLAVVAQSLAERIDYANAHNVIRGYVMLCAEYRAARSDLFAGVTTNDTGPDPLAAALADFRAATSGNNPGPVPAE